MNLIYYLKVLLVGIIQGITEPLPISSSAHMALFKEILNINLNDINLEILLNFASCIAIALFFRKKIFYLFKNTITNKPTKYVHLNRSFFFKLIIASIPIAIVGFLFKDLVDICFSSTLFVGIFLLATSLMLFATFTMLEKKRIMTDSISYFDSIIIGIFQSLAIAPGISRSGTTFFSGTSRNIKLELLFDFSFFLYLIASIGSVILSLFEFNLVSFISSHNVCLLFIIFVITLFSTYLSISLFNKLLSKKTIYCFFLYTLFVGLFLIITNLLLLIPMQI